MGKRFLIQSMALGEMVRRHHVLCHDLILRIESPTKPRSAWNSTVYHLKNKNALQNDLFTRTKFKCLLFTQFEKKIQRKRILNIWIVLNHNLLHEFSSERVKTSFSFHLVWILPRTGGYCLIHRWIHRMTISVSEKREKCVVHIYNTKSTKFISLYFIVHR